MAVPAAPIGAADAPDEPGAQGTPTSVTLEPLAADDREQFIRDSQEAFSYGALEEFGRRDDHFEDEAGEQVISHETIEGSIDEGCALRIKLDGASVGGLVVHINGDRGDLDLLFVSPRIHSRGVGQAAWRAVERRFPQVRVWSLVTPYFEKRNIHFYVNRCGLLRQSLWLSHRGIL